MKARIVLLLFSLTLLTYGLRPAYAQDYTEQDVIDMVSTQSPFAEALDAVPGWTAAAYDTGNAYGLWHVQFWDAEGQAIAWANIAPARERLYDYEATFSATEAQRIAAEPILRDYIQSHPDVIALLGDAEAYWDSTYVEYDGWMQAWNLWIDRGENTVSLTVQFKGLVPDALTEPELIDIRFPNVMSYEEWQTGMQNRATIIAFTHSEIAAVLRGIMNWQSDATRQDDVLWKVVFRGEDTEILTAIVDVERRETIEWMRP